MSKKSQTAGQKCEIIKKNFLSFNRQKLLVKNIPRNVVCSIGFNICVKSQSLVHFSQKCAIKKHCFKTSTNVERGQVVGCLICVTFSEFVIILQDIYYCCRHPTFMQLFTKSTSYKFVVSTDVVSRIRRLEVTSNEDKLKLATSRRNRRLTDSEIHSKSINRSRNIFLFSEKFCEKI